MSSRWISMSLSSPSLPLAACAALTDACTALTSDDFPMPRAPQRSALLAGRPRAKRSVFSTSTSRMRSMPLSSDISTRLTLATGASLRPSGCQENASAAANRGAAATSGASRSSAAAIRSSVGCEGADSPDIRGWAGVLEGAFGRVWPWHAIGCAAPLPGRRHACKIAGWGSQIGRFVEAGQRCNWACGRYSPRRFRWPKPGRRRSRARADSTKDAEMLVTPAFAQASPFGGDSLWVQLLPFVLIFVIMYFLILRPQQKRAKEHQELIKNCAAAIPSLRPVGWSAK